MLQVIVSRTERVPGLWKVGRICETDGRVKDIKSEEVMVEN